MLAPRRERAQSCGVGYRRGRAVEVVLARRARTAPANVRQVVGNRLIAAGLRVRAMDVACEPFDRRCEIAAMLDPEVAGRATRLLPIRRDRDSNVPEGLSAARVSVNLSTAMTTASSESFLVSRLFSVCRSSRRFNDRPSNMIRNPLRQRYFDAIPHC